MSTVAPETPVDVTPGVDDLELLDDDRLHGHCPRCQPAKAFRPFVALCGRRALYTSSRPAIRLLEPPPNVCAECLPIVLNMAAGAPCPTCGTSLR